MNFARTLRRVVREARREGLLTLTQAMALQFFLLNPRWASMLEEEVINEAVARGVLTNEQADSRIDWEAIADFLLAVLPVILEFVLAILGIWFPIPMDRT